MKIKTCLYAMIGAWIFAGSPAYSADKVTIHVSYVNSYMKPIHEEIARRFSQLHPDIAVVLSSPVEAWGDQVQRTILDSATGNRPDIAEHAFNLFGQIADRGLAQPLDSLIKQEKDWASMGYSPALTSLGTYQGKIWGLPFRISTPIIFYNADLLRSVAENPPEFPSDWQGILQVAKRISALGDQRVGMFFDYQADGNWTFQALLNLRGGQLVTSEGKIGFNNAEGLSALTTLNEIGQSGMIDMPREQARQSFAAGILGMYVGSSSQLGNLLKASGNKFSIGTASLPRSASNARIPVGGGIYMLTTKDPKKQAAAWEYIKFATGPVAQTSVVEQTGMMPSNDLPAHDPNLLGKFYSENPLYLASLEQLPIVTTWTAFPGPNSVKISDTIREHLRAVVTLKAKPDIALAAMTKDVEALLR
ncbi:extracellular solute-binding protein [Bradyrhizobium sp. CSA112]|uniref:ABC transporter substrate-binding protein n=1 Tax=Bradyrhizobium sp. CSA112 TaxID=2699170 RepID=UPI0023B03471|nr:ABC transporter substrate-binding protein [Bradyrhizobium sp. CSA112]MDE5457567.1 extracellular solute-binding protein [Bradyrhizobium sp. CSA112]